MNAERSKHWREHREHTRNLRQLAGHTARSDRLSGRLRRIEAVEVHSYPTYTTRRSWPDVGAWFPSVKAVIDGLVDAKALRADTYDVVRALHFEAPRLGAQDGLVVELHPVPPPTP